MRIIIELDNNSQPNVMMSPSTNSNSNNNNNNQQSSSNSADQNIQTVDAGMAQVQGGQASGSSTGLSSETTAPQIKEHGAQSGGAAPASVNV